MELRPYQQEAVDFVGKAIEEKAKSVLVVLPTGCHKINEKLPMHDGSLKSVKRIKIGDKLKGVDGSERTVLYAKSGESDLYKVFIGQLNAKYYLTKDHKITLCDLPYGTCSCSALDLHSHLRDVTISEYELMQDQEKKRWKMVRIIGYKYGFYDLNLFYFTIKPAGVGKYRGFTVDKDNRYLMRHNILTHNCGKTICFSSVINNELVRGGRVLVLAHRTKLLDQAKEKMLMSMGINAEDGDSVVVSSIQAMSRDDHLYNYTKGYFSLIVIDETHHVASSTYQKVIDYFDSAVVFGVTATPIRGDGHDVRDDFERIAPEYTTEKAMQDGYLTPLVVKRIPLNIDISDVPVSCGDFQVTELSQALVRYMSGISNAIAKYCVGHKTVVFVPLVKNAIQLSKMINQNTDLKADYVAGERRDSDDILEQFDKGNIDVLINASLLTEGWDCPKTDCIINLRPTRSKGLYTQMIGRVLRLSPGKEKAYAFDFLWQDNGRGCLNVQDAFSNNENPYMKDAMDQVLGEDGEAELFSLRRRAEPISISMQEAAMLDQAEKANQELQRTRSIIESATASLHEYADAVSLSNGMPKEDVIGILSPNPNVKIKCNCYPAYPMAIKVNDRVFSELGADVYYFEYQTINSLEPPSYKQLQFLSKLKIPTDNILCKSYATFLIDLFANRSKEKMSTYGQIKCLQNFGIQNPSQLTRSEAGKIMSSKIGKPKRKKK